MYALTFGDTLTLNSYCQLSTLVKMLIYDMPNYASQWSRSTGASMAETTASRARLLPARYSQLMV